MNERSAVQCLMLADELVAWAANPPLAQVRTVTYPNAELGDYTETYCVDCQGRAEAGRPCRNCVGFALEAAASRREEARRQYQAPRRHVVTITPLDRSGARTTRVLVHSRQDALQRGVAKLYGKQAYFVKEHGSEFGQIGVGVPRHLGGGTRLITGRVRVDVSAM